VKKKPDRAEIIAYLEGGGEIKPELSAVLAKLLAEPYQPTETVKSEEKQYRHVVIKQGGDFIKQMVVFWQDELKRHSNLDNVTIFKWERLNEMLHNANFTGETSDDGDFYIDGKGARTKAAKALVQSMFDLSEHQLKRVMYRQNMSN